MPKPPAISSLDSHLGFWLRFISNHVSHAFKMKVQAHGVTVAEWVVMRALLDSKGMNPSELAQKITLTRGAVSKLVDRLTAKGFVLRRMEKADRRYQTLALSKPGRRLVPILAALADESDREFFGHLDPRRQADLAAALKEIVHHHGLKSVPVD